MESVDFSQFACVACGTMSPELDHLRSSGFLNVPYLYYTTPGLHQFPAELEKQLRRAVTRLLEKAAGVLVVYGGVFCHVNPDEPERTIDVILADYGHRVARVQATHCMDMVASKDTREELAAGESVFWMTPGWVKFRNHVFAGWDQGAANENFPRHTGGAQVLDGTGYMDRLLGERPEEILDMSDWMGVPLMHHEVGLDRLRGLLAEAGQRLAASVGGACPAADAAAGV